MTVRSNSGTRFNWEDTIDLEEKKEKYVTVRSNSSIRFNWVDSIDQKEKKKEGKYVMVNMAQGMEGQGFPNPRVRGNADLRRYTTGT